MKSTHILLFLPLLALAACNIFSPGVTQPTAEPTVFIMPTALPPTATLPPVATATSAPTATPTLAPSPTPFVPYNVTTAVKGVNLRTNPGYLFPVRLSLAEGMTLLVLNRAPGGEWIYVQTQSKVKGWVFAKLLQPEKDLQSAPILQPEGVQLLKGHLADRAGNPISGVQFMITQGAGQKPPRNDAMTDEAGDFYAFMPSSAKGEWDVTYTAIACTSNTMDANCNCKNGICGNVVPESQKITLPQTEALLFAWE
jgi:SH3-like domain-containing protein